MNGELQSFIKVLLSVLSSLTYCYFIASKIPKGKLRLLSLLPVFSIFTFLPLLLSTVHLTGTTSFFITWLANFKLLLFAFDQGPLSSHPPKSFLRFISIASLPIKIKQNPSPQFIRNETKSPLNNLAIKALLFALLIRIYDYKQYLQRKVVILLYCCHAFLLLEFILALGAFLARLLLGQDLERQSDEPYLSTSLQDFWGRRWNLMVTGILRPTVYNPVRSISERVVGRGLAPLAGVLAAFLVSGLMHELIFYYITHVTPTWEVTCFFLLHGMCTAMEVVVKKTVNGRLRLHRTISGLLTVGFVVVTAMWLFFPPPLRNGADARLIGENLVAIAYVKKKLGEISSITL